MSVCRLQNCLTLLFFPHSNWGKNCMETEIFVDNMYFFKIRTLRCQNVFMHECSYSHIMVTEKLLIIHIYQGFNLNLQVTLIRFAN